MYSVASTASFFLQKRKFNRQRSPNSRNKSVVVDPKGREFRFNVSGDIFIIHESYLNQYPKTLLGSKGREKYFDHKENEYFLDRDPYIFRFIHKFYKTGKVHCSETDCYEAMKDEFDFFNIPTDYLSDCCSDGYFVYLFKKKKKGKVHFSNPTGFREKCWLFCENPSYNNYARMFYYLTCVIIMLSITANTVETMKCKHDINGTVTYSKCSEAHPGVFFSIDTICVSYFTVEFMLRLYSTPQRLQFVKSPMAIIDIMAILPYFVDMLLLRFNVKGKNRILSNLLVALRSFRIVRVFKLVRHSKRLRDLSSTITRATSELGFIVFMYLNIVILFATCIYYAETASGRKSLFVSIPEAMWYTIVTTTTLG